MTLLVSSRRELLQRVGAAVLAMATRTSAAARQAAPAPARIRWAMGWLLWRDYKPRKITLDEALQDLRDVGADGIEFTPRPGELEALGLTRESAKERIQKAGLSVSAHYFSAPFHDATKKDEIFSQAQQQIDSLRTFGARHLVIGPPGPAEGLSRTEAIKRMSPVLTELGRRAGEQGVVIGVHPHLNTAIETPEETDAIMEATDPKFVGLALDTGHFYLAGGDVLQVLAKHGPRLNYLHFKDAVRPFKGPDFFPNLRELGRGQIDFPSVMRALEKLRYSGWINVEQDFTSSTPRESCQTSMTYVREELRKVYA